MHNSAGWAHRSPVAVAQKVTRVVKQTVGNLHIYPCAAWNVEQKSLWWGNIYLKDHTADTRKRTHSIQLSTHLWCDFIQRWDCFNRDCNFRGTRRCVKRPWQYKNGYYIVGQWKLHLYWVDPFCPSNVLWPHTSVCAYKLHSKVCMDSPCSYPRSLVSKAC